MVLLCMGCLQNAWAKKLNLAEQTAAVSQSTSTSTLALVSSPGSRIQSSPVPSRQVKRDQSTPLNVLGTQGLFATMLFFNRQATSNPIYGPVICLKLPSDPWKLPSELTSAFLQAPFRQSFLSQLHVVSCVRNNGLPPIPKEIEESSRSLC